MGLYAFEIERLARLSLPRPFTALSFGHPDILATPADLSHLFGGELPIDNKEVRESRRMSPPEDIIGNARIVFKAMRGKLRVADKYRGYGVDFIVNLNNPIPEGKINSDFDLVIDPGTSEHCFNVGQALVNMASCVGVRGYIYHRVPLAHFNHGFWNFSPCAFYDFYSHNGFEILELVAERGGKTESVPFAKGGPKWIYNNDGRKCQLICMARRNSDTPVTFPTQYKYKSCESE